MHTEGSALSSATSPSRLGSALRSTWRGVLICWHMDLQVLREGLWGKSCCCWMGLVWGDKAQERERVYPCNVCDKAFKYLQMPSQYKIWQHSGYVFACKGYGKKFNPQQQHQQTQQAYVWQEFLPLFHVGQGPPLRRSSSIWMCGGRRRGRRPIWQAPARAETSFTPSNENLLCVLFLIN